MNKRDIYRIILKFQGFPMLCDFVLKTPLRLKGRKQYRKDRRLYKNLNTHNNFSIQKKYEYPILTERYESAGGGGTYFWQDLWCARLIAENNPTEHYDIGSRIDGFIAHLASFRGKVHLIDVRPLEYDIPGVDFVQADATNLSSIPDNSIESLSALCSLEHFGLGRYGDPIDPDACFKAMSSIARVLKQGGLAYISVPIGREHLEFNAHRIFNTSTVIEAFPGMELVEFSSTRGDSLERNIPVNKYDDEDNMGGRFGLFLFKKK